MRDFRKVRRAMNQRLAKADREGRLALELGLIEREALEWWFQAVPGKARSRRRPGPQRAISS